MTQKPSRGPGGVAEGAEVGDPSESMRLLVGWRDEVHHTRVHSGDMALGSIEGLLEGGSQEVL